MGSLEYYVGTDVWVKAIIGVVLAGLTAYVIYGGKRTITWVTSVLVPIMAVLYLIIGFVILFANLGGLGHMFSVIFDQAFDFKAIFGGFAGSVVMYGIKRGLFSNEAGMGSAPNAAAAAHTSHPAKQGFVQMLSVFIDTMVICTTTAGIVLLSGVSWESGEQPMKVVQSAVETQFEKAGILIVTIAVFLFAFSSIIGNYYYTESNMFFIQGHHSNLHIFRGTVIVAVFVGTMNSVTLAWNLADMFMVFMTVINIFAILLLSNQAARVLRDYTRQRREGRDPVFIGEAAGFSNLDFWHSEAEARGVVA
jgi:AGCS family alanine or glycine:cation symporter